MKPEDEIKIIGWEKEERTDVPLYISLGILAFFLIALTIHSCVQQPNKTVLTPPATPTPTPALHRHAR